MQTSPAVPWAASIVQTDLIEKDAGNTATCIAVEDEGSGILYRACRFRSNGNLELGGLATDEDFPETPPAAFTAATYVEVMDSESPDETHLTPDRVKSVAKILPVTLSGTIIGKMTAKGVKTNALP